MVVAIDARARPDGGGLGGLHPRRAPADRHGRRGLGGQRAPAWGAGEILLTSMDRDGTRDGFDLALTRAVVDAVGVPVVASGGVGTLDHLVEGAVEGGADAVLAASIFHRREHTVAEAKAHLAAARGGGAAGSPAARRGTGAAGTARRPMRYRAR